MGTGLPIQYAIALISQSHRNDDGGTVGEYGIVSPIQYAIGSNIPSHRYHQAGTVEGHGTVPTSNTQLALIAQPQRHPQAGYGILSPIEYAIVPNIPITQTPSGRGSARVRDSIIHLCNTQLALISQSHRHPQAGYGILSPIEYVIVPNIPITDILRQRQCKGTG
jgi:hypothetical protein